MNIIMLGAPGAGKGSTSEKLIKKYNIVSISTGDIIRENIHNKTELGILAEKLINNGQLVPDDLVIDLVKDRLSKDDVKNGFILDGFPRTIEQAKVLKTFEKIDYVIYLETDYQVIEDRILSRRICPNCKLIYNTRWHKSEFCDVCGTKLVKRDDDNIETVKKRFDVFNKQTAPLVKFYENENILHTVNGNLTVQEVCEEIDKFIQK